MSIREIVKYPDPRLRNEAESVAEVDGAVRDILNDMVDTMYAAPGLGLAAPQVGIAQRLIVVDVGDDEESGRQGRLYKLVNPEIVNRSGEIEFEEGCLSIPSIREYVRRSASVTVEALSESGSPLTIEAEGLLAVCLQHEIDHLNGVLFIDHLSRLKRELIKGKISKMSDTPRSKRL